MGTIKQENAVPAMDILQAFSGAGNGLAGKPEQPNVVDREKFILNEEGFFKNPELDSRGILTVGPGLNLEEESIRKQIPEDVLNGTREFTVEEAMPIFRERIDIATKDAIDFAGKKAFDKLSENQKTALISLSFNLGKSKLSGFEETQKALIKGDLKRAASEAFDFEKALRARQLPARSEREKILFLGE